MTTADRGGCSRGPHDTTMTPPPPHMAPDDNDNGHDGFRAPDCSGAAHCAKGDDVFEQLGPKLPSRSRWRRWPRRPPRHEDHNAVVWPRDRCLIDCQVRLAATRLESGRGAGLAQNGRQQTREWAGKR